MLVISTHENVAFRTEELESIYRIKNRNRITKFIGLRFKSGFQITIDCKTLKETKELFDTITKVMQQDYNNLIK